MKRLFASVTALLFLSMAPANATMYINYDVGGEIANYVTKYVPLRFNKEKVVITGLCASACTIVLGAVPIERICVVLDNAKLGFHSAWDHKEVTDGVEVKVKGFEATDWLWRMYPDAVKRWIINKGGLPEPGGMIYLQGTELGDIIKPCSADDLA